MAATEQQVTLRWSSVRDCPRKAVYEATGAPHRDRTDREDRILWRGKSLGRDYAAFLANKYGPDNIRTEAQVRWPLGIGHIDIYLADTRTAIEVLSSAHASEQMIHSKLLQLVGYIEHADPDTLPIDAGALVVLNPSDLTEDVFPVAKSSRTYAGLVDEMLERVASVQRWAATRELPQRVCGKPADALQHFCQYAAHCFEGWEAPPLAEVVAETKTVAAVVSLREIKQERRALSQRDATLEEQQKKMQQLLDDLPVGAVRVDRFQVKRVHVQRKPTFQWEKAELAGVFEPGLYDAFFKPGAAYDTFDVEAVAEADHGEVPF